jgi:hypothetical protein
MVEQIDRSPSRIRPLRSGRWSRNNVFAKCDCAGCDGLMIHGVCQKCGRAVVCAWCKTAVKQNDGNWRRMAILDTEKTSHGICAPCKKAYYAYYARPNSIVPNSIIKEVCCGS